MLCLLVSYLGNVEPLRPHFSVGQGAGAWEERPELGLSEDDTMIGIMDPSIAGGQGDKIENGHKCAVNESILHISAAAAAMLVVVRPMSPRGTQSSNQKRGHT